MDINDKYGIDVDDIYSISDIGGLSQPGGSLFNIEHSNGGLITFPGGIPIKDNDGKTIGAIGVSGSTVENDHLVAQAGVDAVNNNSK